MEYNFSEAYPRLHDSENSYVAELDMLYREVKESFNVYKSCEDIHNKVAFISFDFLERAGEELSYSYKVYKTTFEYL